MKRLLAPDGCPWDREQTLESLRPYVIEEAHEVAEAIDNRSAEQLKEELGDLLFQIVFQSELAASKGWFNIDDVIAGVCEKMERRHPHVFGGERLDNATQVLQRWETLKAQEKQRKTLFEGIPLSMPALLRALRSAEKAARRGFDIGNATQARKMVDQELTELDQAVVVGIFTDIEREFGDVLFALCNLARKLQVDPEGALSRTLRRFTARVSYCMEHLERDGEDPQQVATSRLDALWQDAKNHEATTFER